MGDSKSSHEIKLFDNLGEVSREDAFVREINDLFTIQSGRGDEGAIRAYLAGRSIASYDSEAHVGTCRRGQG